MTSEFRVKYIRVVLAINPDVPATSLGLTFDERLDIFIEEDDAIVGAYVSGEYGTRGEALDGEWRDKFHQQRK